MSNINSIVLEYLYGVDKGVARVFQIKTSADKCLVPFPKLEEIISFYFKHNKEIKIENSESSNDSESDDDVKTRADCLNGKLTAASHEELKKVISNKGVDDDDKVPDSVASKMEPLKKNLNGKNSKEKSLKQIPSVDIERKKKSRKRPSETIQEAEVLDKSEKIPRKLLHLQTEESSSSNRTDELTSNFGNKKLILQTTGKSSHDAHDNEDNQCDNLNKNGSESNIEIKKKKKKKVKSSLLNSTEVESNSDDKVNQQSNSAENVTNLKKTQKKNKLIVEKDSFVEEEHQSETQSENQFQANQDHSQEFELNSSSYTDFTKTKNKKFANTNVEMRNNSSPNSVAFKKKGSKSMENVKNTSFRRVKAEEVLIDERVKDMSFEGKKNASGSWGDKANRDLKHTRGKSFKHEKTKKKRGSYRGGFIDMGVNSIKFD